MLVHTRVRQIFGTTRWGRPSRFLSNIPADVVIHRATRSAALPPQPRYVDGSARAPSPFVHPQEVEPAFEGDEEVFSLRGSPPSSMARSEEVGGRYVDRDYFSDDVDSGDASRGLRRGAKVHHDHFGEGVVRQVLPSVDPAVVAYFPSWGEKKVLVRYLKLA
jgi:DNA helicase-2/ATP-dependent DNA helicase PcrA